MRSSARRTNISRPSITIRGARGDQAGQDDSRQHHFIPMSGSPQWMTSAHRSPGAEAIESGQRLPIVGINEAFCCGSKTQFPFLPCLRCQAPWLVCAKKTVAPQARNRHRLARRVLGECLTTTRAGPALVQSNSEHDSLGTTMNTYQSFRIAPVDFFAFLAERSAVSGGRRAPFGVFVR